MLRYSGPKRLDWGPTTTVMPSTGQYARAVATDAGVNQTTYSIDDSGKIISATVDGNETWIASKFSLFRPLDQMLTNARCGVPQ